MEFSLTSLGTLIYDFVMKTSKMFSFVPLINNSVITGLHFLLLIILAIMSPKYINTICFFWIVIVNSYINIIHIIRIFD